MKQSWTQGLTDDVAKEIRGDFTSSLILRRRLVKILRDKISEEHRASIQKNMYESPSWPLLMADNVGFERALEYVISLIDE